MSLNLTTWEESELFEKALSQLFVEETPLHEAINYSLLDGGKRLRPRLCFEAIKALGFDPALGLPVACAIEMVHTYSLIHDDLPCMDDDDLRRGKPTCHKVYGEAMAVLAGDALLTKAFEVIAVSPINNFYDLKRYLLELSYASGSTQLIQGQVFDMIAENNPKITLEQLKAIHCAKTGALIKASLRLGGMVAEANLQELEALTEYGEHIGLAFQIRDDILDATETSANLGKTAGKDKQANKSTYVSILGLEQATLELNKLIDEACISIEKLTVETPVNLQNLAQALKI